MYYVAWRATHIRFHSVVVITLDFESNNTSSTLVGSFYCNFTFLAQIKIIKALADVLIYMHIYIYTQSYTYKITNAGIY